MQTQDEDLWQQQCMELMEDKVGKAFLEFVTDWLDTAEAVMDSDTSLSPTSALRASLAPVEERLGRISASFVGQMLVVVISHWKWGHQVSPELSPIERRLMEDMLILKLNELRESAELPEDTE